MQEHGAVGGMKKGGSRRPSSPRKNLLNAEVGEDLGLGFVHFKQVVAGRAILRDPFAIF